MCLGVLRNIGGCMYVMFNQRDINCHLWGCTAVHRDI